MSDCDLDSCVADAPDVVDKHLKYADLSRDQANVFDAMMSWWGTAGPRQILTVGGLAGTGKTTLLGVFAAQKRGLVAYVTYTGRAASVLARKLRASGVETTSLADGTGVGDLCSTIHSLLYRPIIDAATEKVLGWARRDKLDRPYKLIVVDEASMVSDEILQDILAHNVPLLAVGDHGQLPPVGARGDLIQNPKLRLEKIHRQAQDSPIIALAHHIREGGRFSNFKMKKGFESAIQFRSKAIFPAVLAAGFSKAGLETGALCWTNRVRIRMNAIIRTSRKWAGPPKRGEILICLKNQPPVYNGMRGVLSNDPTAGDKPWKMRCRLEFPDEGIPASMYDVCIPQFNRQGTYGDLEEMLADRIDVNTMRDAGGLFDFGYALTTHKSQGSSFEHALLFCDRPEDPKSEDSRRFYYTAVTRAARKLTVIR
jgi:exodeoxyribonuclease V